MLREALRRLASPLTAILFDEEASVLAEYAIVLASVSIGSLLALQALQTNATTTIQKNATNMSQMNLNSYIAGE